MSEADAIARSAERGPATLTTLTSDLRSLGVVEGQTLIVHTALSRLGWVAGGPITLIHALRKAIGSSGTLVMPTHSAGLSDPATWQNPPVPEAWWQQVREELPAFDPCETPTREMGVVAEAFRSLPGALRSNHPIGSFAAQGPNASVFTAEHPREDIFGDGSPLGRLYDLDASLLLLGVGHANNTSLHLAECRVGTEWREQGSPVLRGGQRRWVTYRERRHDSDDFTPIGEAYAAGGGTVRTGRVGSGDGLLAPVREMVDFAVAWMVDRRGATV
ncbi:MAG: AAC(3) family N-acetyltransferase [Planctomycetota bacterium]